MSLLEKEPTSSVKSIWNEYHAAKPGTVSSVISANQFELLEKRAKASPYFIFPLRRKSGYFLLLSQAQGQTNLFTYLEDYKRHPESSNPYFVLTLFEELQAKKGIIPVRGDIIDNRISQNEAEVLMMAFLAHYIEGGLYEETIFLFNQEPEKFDHSRFIEKFFSRFPVTDNK